MSYRFEHSESVETGLRRIAGEQIAKARGELGIADRVEAVHQVRKRCKKLRGLVRLTRPAMGDRYGVENTRFRDIARRLAHLRDAHVMLATFDALLAEHQANVDRRRFTPLRQQLVAHRDATPSDGLDAQLAAADQAFADAQQAIDAWTLSERGFDALAGGFDKTYRRARDGCRDARRSIKTDVWHDWRKRVKYHRFHCALLRKAWPRPIKARVAELDRLGDLLGDDHDLAVLMAWVDDNRRLRPDNHDAFRQLLDQQRDRLRAHAIPMGQRLFVDKPKALTRRMRRFWVIWRD